MKPYLSNDWIAKVRFTDLSPFMSPATFNQIVSQVQTKQMENIQVYAAVNHMLF
jgi:hypothetical protein